jgi:SAM-dependent methyltransferase
VRDVWHALSGRRLRRWHGGADGRGAKVSDTDAAEALLEIARRRTPEGDFRCGDMEELPFAAQSFEAVTGFNSLQYAGNPAVALREARRVSRLRQGEGRLVRSGLKKIAACRDREGTLHLHSANCTHLGCVALEFPGAMLGLPLPRLAIRARWDRPQWTSRFAPCRHPEAGQA